MAEVTPPLVLAGPILRRCTPTRLTLWLATTAPVICRYTVFPESERAQELLTESPEEQTRAVKQLKAAANLHFVLLDIVLAEPLPCDTWIGYTLELQAAGSSQWQGWSEWAPKICYPGKSTPGFVLRKQVTSLLHGSCRKPHFTGADGLVIADEHLATVLQQPKEWPALLMMSGDQIYADDVAGPMLQAIHQLIAVLDFPAECLPECAVAKSTELHSDQACYYERANLLPNTQQNLDLRRLFFGGVEKPVFTTDNAHNHLISLAEVLSMYLLVWSPVPWTMLQGQASAVLDEQWQATYHQQQSALDGFKANLAAVQRVLAHLPVAMIFDDHDITDDWNLTAAWEQTAYAHPFSRRIIGNALVGYLICQGWGNAPEAFADELLAQCQQALAKPGTEHHDEFITELLRFSDWHYQWDTSPVLIVLDTRTHRWRSEKSLENPSGLMDWEALTDLQMSLLGHDAVIMVSPAPVFGVKFIESVQRLFTWIGKPLMVDAENWMAHKGAAYALMNLFRHSKTPQHFVILSGDVHYSFVYDIQLRGQARGPDIWQITSSGLRNRFPARLLDIFDRLDRWLYAPWSPLNWFTKRRRMRIVPRKPDTASIGERLLNQEGIGYVVLDEQGAPTRVLQLCENRQHIAFEVDETAARWE